MFLFYAVPAMLTAWGLAELFDWMDGTQTADTDDDSAPDDTDTAIVDPDTTIVDDETDSEPDLTNAIVGTDADDVLFTEDKETDLFGGEGKDVFWVNDWALADIVSTYDVEADHAVFDESNDFTVIKDYDYKSGDRILIGYNWLPDSEGTPAPDMSAAPDGGGFGVSTSYGQLADGTMGTLIYGSPIKAEGGTFVAAPVFVEGLHYHSFFVDPVAWLVNDTTDPIDQDALQAAVLNDEAQIYAASEFTNLINTVKGTDGDDLVHTEDETANLYGGDGADVFWVSEKEQSGFDITTDAAYDDPNSDPYGKYLQISDDAEITVVRDFAYDSGDRLLIDVNWYPDTAGTAAPTDGLSGIYTNVVAAELPDGTKGALFYSDSSVLKPTEDGQSLNGTFEMTPVFVAGYGNPFEFETFGVTYLIRDTDDPVDEAALAADVRAANLNTVSFNASDYSTVTNKIIGTDDDDLVHSDDNTANLYGGDGADVFWVRETANSDLITTDAAYTDPDTDPNSEYVKIKEDADVIVVRDYDHSSGDRLLIDVNWHPADDAATAPTDPEYVNIASVYAELPDGTTGMLFYSNLNPLPPEDAGDSDGSEYVVESYVMTPIFVAGLTNPTNQAFPEGITFLIRDTDAELDETALEADVHAAAGTLVQFKASDYVATV